MEKDRVEQSPELGEVIETVKDLIAQVDGKIKQISGAPDKQCI